MDLTPDLSLLHWLLLDFNLSLLLGFFNDGLDLGGRSGLWLVLAGVLLAWADFSCKVISVDAVREGIPSRSWLDSCNRCVREFEGHVVWERERSVVDLGEVEFASNKSCGQTVAVECSEGGTVCQEEIKP